MTIRPHKMTPKNLTEWRRAQHPRVTLEQLGARLSPPVSKATVLRWERDGVPVNRLAEISAITGLTRNILRPDIFEAA